MAADYKKKLEEYEKSVEEHVQKVNTQLDEQLASMKQKHKVKLELTKELENEVRKTTEENLKMKQHMEKMQKEIHHYNNEIHSNTEKMRKTEKKIAEIKEKLPNIAKTEEDLLKQLNEKRRIIVEKEKELGNYRLNHTEQSMLNKLEKTKNTLEEIRKKKIAQDKKIGRLREDISQSEKSYDKIENEIRKEMQRQLLNESKSDEVERRIRIFEIEHWGVEDEFKKLLITLDREPKEENADFEKLQFRITKGEKYVEKLDEIIRKLEENPNSIDTIIAEKPIVTQKRKNRTRSQETEKRWKNLDTMKKEIIQLKREYEALGAAKNRLCNEKTELEKILEETQKDANKAAFELRNAENIRISELNQANRKLRPSILIESKKDKFERENQVKYEKLKDVVEKLEKENQEKKNDLLNIKRRIYNMQRKLAGFNKDDGSHFENEKIEMEGKLRSLKRKYHENIMTLNVLHKKLQHRVLQREAALTKANSVIHLNTNIREERNREIEELQKELGDTRNKL